MANSVDRLDGISGGLGIKAPVRVATTGSIALTGLQTIDGVTLVEGDRVLVKSQTDAKENGVYNASSGVWVRASDFDGNRDIVQGTNVFVFQGTANGLQQYFVSSSNPIRIGDSNITFSKIVSYFFEAGTESDLESSLVPEAIDYVRTAGYATVDDGGARLYARRETEPTNPAKIQSEDNSWWEAIPRRKYVIFAAGQSNIDNRIEYDWTPPRNLYVWGFWGSVRADDYVADSWEQGGQFTYLDTDYVYMSTPVGMGAKLARENPDCDVYIIGIARGALDLSNWGDTPPDYNMRQAIDNNVPPALASIGVDKIDLMLWWQGENDAGDDNTTYHTQFEADVAIYLKTKEWFPAGTPIFMYGLPPYYDDGLDARYTSYIQTCVANDPATRRFIDISSIPVTEWDSEVGPYLHMSAHGYLLAGERAAEAYTSGQHDPLMRGWVRNPWTGAWSCSLAGPMDFLAPPVPAWTFGATWGFVGSRAAEVLNFGLINYGGSTGGAEFAVTGAGNTALLGAYPAAGPLPAYTALKMGSGLAVIYPTETDDVLTLGDGGFEHDMFTVRQNGLCFRPKTSLPAAITNGDLVITSADSTHITFTLRQGGSNKSVTLTLS